MECRVILCAGVCPTHLTFPVTFSCSGFHAPTCFSLLTWHLSNSNSFAFGPQPENVSGRIVYVGTGFVSTCDDSAICQLDASLPCIGGNGGKNGFCAQCAVNTQNPSSDQVSVELRGKACTKSAEHRLG